MLRQRTLARACAPCDALIITKKLTDITMASISSLPAILLLATALSAATALSDGPSDALGLPCPHFPRQGHLFTAEKQGRGRRDDAAAATAAAAAAAAGLLLLGPPDCPSSAHASLQARLHAEVADGTLACASARLGSCVHHQQARPGLAVSRLCGGGRQACPAPAVRAARLHPA